MGGEEEEEEEFIEHEIAEEDRPVARAQTSLYLAPGLFPLSLKSGTDPAPSLKGLGHLLP